MDELGLIGKETVSIDGTKIKASNSKKNNHNAKSLERKRKYHEHRINEYLQDLDKNDELEDGQPRKSAEEIQEIVRKLNECKAKIETLEKTMKETGMPKKTLPTTLKQTPTPAPQARNFTREGGAAKKEHSLVGTTRISKPARPVKNAANAPKPKGAAPLPAMLTRIFWTK